MGSGAAPNWRISGRCATSVSVCGSGTTVHKRFEGYRRLATLSPAPCALPFANLHNSNDINNQFLSDTRGCCCLADHVLFPQSHGTNLEHARFAGNNRFASPNQLSKF